ncbi:MAG: hypothetical protein IME94_05520 [Proteobacteria bacterium]|nr:hypothetical protein [Pseudomonadota bacterium]
MKVDTYGTIAQNAVIDMREQGRSYSDIAVTLGISLRLLRSWFEKYDGLREAVAAADKFVEESAEHALIQLALGYYGKETKVFMYKGDIIEKEVTKWYPPNPKALEFLLKNINPTKWQDKREITLSAALPTVNSFQEAKSVIASDPTLLPAAKE